MRTPAAVRVNDDLPAGESGVPLRATDDELTRRVDVHVARLTVVQRDRWLAVLEDDLLKRLLHDMLHDRLVHVLHGWGSLILASVASDLRLALGLLRLSVLGGDDDRVDLHRFDRAICVLLVLDRDLRLAIRTQPPERAILAHIRELLAKSRRDEVRERHAVLGLVRGVAEHDALVTSADVEIILADVHAARDVRRLLVDAHKHLARVARHALRCDR
mmetsp:Transcript_26063/g.67361  ORF Transcript_26063/g.67361 Transcript_26063/m.67361 type:complete len:217 (-) Transcript_26063:348-998(-)